MSSPVTFIVELHFDPQEIKGWCIGVLMNMLALKIIMHNLVIIICKTLDKLLLKMKE